MKPEERTIEIRPDSSVYGTFRRMAYRPWEAIAEFVDNSTQNYFTHRKTIADTMEGNPALEIDIVHDSKAKTLTILDNANGMNWEELERAIQLNKPPADTSGRSEFGMGLKMAACWFGRRWRVVTKRLGEQIEYEALVDVERLEIDKPDAIVVLQRMGLEPSEHYTRIEIEDLYRTFRGRSIPSIQENIASMYRRDINSGEITIKWMGEPFKWDSDPVYEETAPDGSPIRWEKDLEFEVAGLEVTGRVWIRLPGEAKRAGMHLFRRGRLVVGGPNQGYKPSEIFGAPNSFQSQRLVGELDLDNWPVTQTKNAFDWAGELENEFIDKLREHTTDYVQQARSVRDPESTKTTSADGKLVGDNTRTALQGSEVDSMIHIVETGPPPPAFPPEEDLVRIRAAAERSGEPTRIQVGSEGIPTLKAYWVEDLAPTESHASFSMPTDAELLLYINLNHPFVERAIRRDPSKLELYALTLYADALVERGILKRGHNVPANTFRDFKDKFLRVIEPTH